MNWLLQGPFPLDTNNVAGSAKTALGAVDRVFGSGGADYLREVAVPGHEPGVYLFWRLAGQKKPSLVGFWIVHGHDYLLTGPVGPPDREPPMAREVLSALTEAVWWKQFTVWPRKGGTWRPLVVQEWIPEVANRSMFPPPGRPPAENEMADEEDDDGEDRGGGWLEPLDGSAESSGVAAIEVRPMELPLQGSSEEQDLWVRLPGRRTIVSIVQGQMTASGASHKATFRLLPPAWFSEHVGSDSIPMDDWVETATRKGKLKVEDERHELGHPMAMMGGRVGFPLSGWLTRSLGPWPNQPLEAAVGELAERDTGSKWLSQARQSIGVTVSVLLAVLTLSWGVWQATRPHIEPAPEIPIPAPQPALSVCSADHFQFVEEFRCQIKHFAGGGTIDSPVCSDPDAAPGMSATDADLQADYCGLRDRIRDGWLAGDEESGFSYSDLAASKACFNVLGHPYSYAMARDYSSLAARKVDPDRFLRDVNLSIRALVDLVADLDEACNQYGDRLEHQISGGVVATHVGEKVELDQLPEEQSDPAKLRAHVVRRVSDGMSDSNKRCFQQGTTDDIEQAQTYRDLCGGSDSLDDQLDKVKSWKVLSGKIEMGSGYEDLVKRYSVARFGYVGQKERAQSAPLWSCHLELADSQTVAAEVGVMWDLTIPAPSSYDVNGAGVRSQLALDSSLLAFAEGADGGVCWSVVKEQLERYTPVHPLIAPLEPAGFPSAEQQLCGQVCAVGYRIRRSPASGEWVTRENDLDLCVNVGKVDDGDVSGRGSLDALRLPWNGEAPMGWSQPEQAAVCAFNLVAQQYMPQNVLVEDMAPPIWAGQVQGDAGILGTSDGMAAVAAGNLSSYARARSVSTCGHVAAQCFMTGLLKVTGTYSEPYLWMDKWTDWLLDVSEGMSGEKGEEMSPWCDMIQPYVTMDGSLPEGQLDYPCAKGVDDALLAAQDTLRNLASGAYADSMR